MKKKKYTFLAFLLAFVLFSGVLSPLGYGEEKNSIVVFDTDVGTDDAMAFLVAHKADKNLFDYIVASQGNTSLNGAVRNALILKKYLDLNATIVQGMPPKADENVNAEEKNTFHGLDGMANIRENIRQRLNMSDLELKKYLTYNDYVAELADCDEILYIAVGPTTNLANLIKDEAIKAKISKVYIMGGGISVFNCTNDTEFNFSKDPRSVANILSSGLDITLFPLDLTNRQRVDAKQIDELEETGHFAEFITFLRFNLKSNSLYNKIRAAVLHDVMPILYYIDPSSFRIEDMRITVDQYGSTKVSEDGTLIHVAVEAEEPLLKDHLKEIFKIGKR